MSSQSVEQDNSIEEILASIRQIISEDEPAPAPAAAPAAASAAPVAPPPALEEPAAPAPVASQDSVDDIFELNDRVDEPAPAPEPVVVAEEPAPALEPVPEPAPALEPAPDIQVELRERPEDAFFAPLPEPAAPAVAAPLPDAALFTDAAATATLGAFSKLSDTILIERQRAIAGSSITLEDIVKELLSPILREWIDHHVPGLVERLVREELEKLARQAREG